MTPRTPSEARASQTVQCVGLGKLVERIAFSGAGAILLNVTGSGTRRHGCRKGASFCPCEADVSYENLWLPEGRPCELHMPNEFLPS